MMDVRARSFAIVVSTVLALGIIWVTAHAAIVAEANRPPEGESRLPKVRMTLGNTTIDAVVAGTDRSRREGLLGWDTISDDVGMLLDFGSEGKYAIHMQGMKFPIDALWIDASGVIKVIYEDIRPNSGLTYPSMFPAAYCLEVKAGFCKKFGIRMGQSVAFGTVRR